MKKTAGEKCFELILNYNCNARCLFCSQGGFDKSRNAPFAAIARNIYAARKAGYGRLGLTGGEPLIRPDILKVIALGKSVGFDFIRVQTNGIKLADAAFCAGLVKAGLTFCKFSFTTDREKDHDALTGAPGAFKKALAGLGHLRRLKIRVGTNILVNRRNYRRLPEIIKFFLERGITNFVVIYPVYTGAMAANAGKLGVSLPQCAPHFLRAVRTMEAAGLPGEILFLNTPPCFISGRESLAIGLDAFNTVVTDPDGKRTDLDAVQWAGQAQELGAGEILLTSMDADGTKQGFDLELTQQVAEAVSIPVIASGGCGSPEHILEVLRETKAEAALAASIFHYGQCSVAGVKQYLRENGVVVR